MAFCGVLPEEEARRQPFEVDVDVECDVSAAAATDDLDETIDYGALVANIEALSVERRYGLLERFASDIAEVVLANGLASATTVSIRKLRPPVPQDLASSGVTIRRAAS